jgi:hypothetical protein
LLKGAPLKGPIVKLPEGTKVLQLKPNETLLGVKKNRSGEIVCTKYTNGECPYFEGVRAHPSKVKFIPLKEAPKHALASSEAPPKCHKTIANLEKEFQAQHEVTTSLVSSYRFLSRCVLNLNEKIDNVERRNKKICDRVTALEHLGN